MIASLTPLWTIAGTLLGLLAVTVAALAVKGARGPVPLRQRFWINLNAVYCKLWFGLRCVGPVTIPRQGPVIVVANHTSGIDPILLIACSPERPIGFLIAEEYYDLPVFGFLIKAMECIPVRRGEADIGATKASLRHIRACKVLGIFPEGRISAPGERAEFKDGAAMLAIRTGATVVPAHISGTRFEENLTWAFFRRQRARVRFGEPIQPGIPPHQRDRETLGRLTALFDERIRALAPAGGPSDAESCLTNSTLKPEG